MQTKRRPGERKTKPQQSEDPVEKAASERLDFPNGVGGGGVPHDSIKDSAQTRKTT